MQKFQLQRKFWPLLLVLFSLPFSWWLFDKPQSPPRAIKEAVHKPHPPMQPAFAMAEASALPKFNDTMLKIKKRFYAGDYQATADMITSELESKTLDPDFRQWLLDQYPVVLTSLGWFKLRTANCSEAIVHFEESMRFIKLSETIKGLAYCYHKQTNFNAAFEYFSQYFSYSPKDWNMLLLFTDVLESRGDFNRATEIIRDILTHAHLPAEEQEQLKKKLNSMLAKSREALNQGTINTTHFMIRYRFGEHDDLAHHFSYALEQVLDTFIMRYGFRAPERIIEVTFYTSESFNELVAHSPAWAQALYDGRIRVPTPPSEELHNEAREQLTRVLRHELVHALLNEIVDNRPLPSWFNEGLAQRLECDDCRQSEFPLLSSGFLNKDSLTGSFLSFNAGKAKIAYTQSLYLILTLENEMRVEDALYKLVKSLTPYTRMDSDEILKPLGFNFDTLREVASLNWQKKKTYYW